MNFNGAAEQMKKKKKKRNLTDGGKIYPWSHDKNKSVSFSLRRKSKSLNNYNENK